MADLKVISPEELRDQGWTLDKFDEFSMLSDWSRFNPATEQAEFITIQHDLQDLIDRNKEMETNSNGQRFGDGKIVASIPMPVFNQYLADAVANKDRKHIKRFLNDPGNKKFRTFRGNI